MKAVINSVMCAKIGAMPWLWIMQNLQLLTLRWCSFSVSSREHVAVVFDPRGCQYLLNGCLQPIGTYMTQDTWLPIVDTPSTIIFRVGRWACCCLLCQYMLPIRHLCITVTTSLFNDHTYKNTNCWLSVDAHSQNAMVTVLLSLLPPKATNTSVMENSIQINIQWPYLQDHKVLTLQWCSFSEWGGDRVAVSFA